MTSKEEGLYLPDIGSESDTIKSLKLTCETQKKDLAEKEQKCNAL